MPARRAVLAAPALTLAVLLAGAAPAPAAPPSPDRGGPGPVPVPRALTADGKPAKTDDILEHCGEKRSNCVFRIDTRAGGEFATAVKTLGSVINCTQSDMKIDRKLTLHAGSTDNISGEISGSVTAEGTVEASGEVTTNLTQGITSNHKTPDLSKGPTSENGTNTTVAGGGKVAGSINAKLAFQAAFKAAYGKSWTVDSTEETTYGATVNPHDMMVFGASVAMRRIVGQLVTDQGSRILNIAVDSPSMVNSSHFVAQTYAASTCGGTRPAPNTAPDTNNTP